MRTFALILSVMAKQDPDLSLLFHALSDATRRDMLAALAKGPVTVSALAAPTGLRLPTVMRHLGVLEQAGLIATNKDGRVRSCALVPAALEPMQGWLAAQRSVWEARLDRFDDYVMTLMEKRDDTNKP
jgi:DNA-binding transcriptional ArsR family regulator